jgi:hypothetical protein
LAAVDPESYPPIEVRGHIGLVSPLKQRILLWSWSESGCFATYILGPCREPILKSCLLFETATLHVAAPFHLRKKAGAQPAFSSPIKATICAVMNRVCAVNRKIASDFIGDRAGTKRRTARGLFFSYLLKVTRDISEPAPHLPS